MKTNVQNVRCSKIAGNDRQQ